MHDPENYHSLFQRYTVRNAEQILINVKNEHSPLTEEIKAQALCTLTYLLNSKYPTDISGQLLTALSSKMEHAGYRDEWIPYLEKWLSSVSSSCSLLHKAEVEYQLGFLYQLCADFQPARDHLQASFNIFESLSQNSGQARALNRLAYLERLQSHHQNAQKNVATALKLLDENASDREFSFFILAVLAEDAGNFPEAIRYHRISLALCEQLGEQHKIALRLGNLGLGLYFNKEYDEAIACYERSMTIFATLGDKFRRAGIQLNLGTVYLVSGQPSRAIDLFLQSETVYRSLHDTQHLALVYLNLGIALRDLKNLAKSQEMLITSIEHWQQMGLISSLVNAIDELGLTYMASNSYELALGRFSEALSQLRSQPHLAEYKKLETRLLSHISNAQNALVNIESNRHKQ